MSFEVGKVYRRVEEIHADYGGQEQGGISTPAKHPLVFLFVGEGGSAYGYEDGFRDDGVFWFNGVGHRGSMTMSRGNAAIRSHITDGRALLLFEYVSKGKVMFLGEAAYLSHHLTVQADLRGKARKAIVFELEVLTGAQGAAEYSSGDTVPVPENSRLWTRPLAEVRDIATRRATTGAPAKIRRRAILLRASAIRAYALRRGDGICEACGRQAPFLSSEGRPYLEVHHARRSEDAGPDDPRHVAAICPNCHREIHAGKGGTALNLKLCAKVARKEALQARQMNFGFPESPA